MGSQIGRNVEVILVHISVERERERESCQLWSYCTLELVTKQTYPATTM